MLSEDGEPRGGTIDFRSEKEGAVLGVPVQLLLSNSTDQALEEFERAILTLLNESMIRSVL